MAVLSAKDIWEMNADEIDERLDQMASELMKIRGVLSSGGVPEEVGKAREIRRTIARLQTIRHLKEKGQQPSRKATPAAEPPATAAANSQTKK